MDTRPITRLIHCRAVTLCNIGKYELYHNAIQHCSNHAVIIAITGMGVLHNAICKKTHVPFKAMAPSQFTIKFNPICYLSSPHITDKLFTISKWWKCFWVHITHRLWYLKIKKWFWWPQSDTNLWWYMCVRVCTCLYKLFSLQFTGK